MASEDPALERLLEYLRDTRGFDFTGYKRASLARRISKRMGDVGVQGFEPYVDYLEVHPDEFAALFDTILINVTEFFRDPPAWDYVASQVVPTLVESKGEGEIRVWSAACASGEEAYTLAIVLLEAVGPEAFRERVKIYATDVDDDALLTARSATYPVSALSNVPEVLVERYFEGDDEKVFRQDLRRSIIFGRHDLVQDAPISRIDLLACRNTLMYFNAETQQRILDRFHFALDGAGYLFLGRAETLPTRNDRYETVDLKRRVFRKVPGADRRDRKVALAGFGVDDGEGAGTYDLSRVAFQAGASAQLVVDGDGYLVLANDHARRIFGLRDHDIGRLFHDLEVSYRPIELRSLMERAVNEPVLMHGVRWAARSGEQRTYDAQVTALPGPGRARGVVVTFTDVSTYSALEEDLQSANRELETAYEELQSTNEELETTNEELQSTVEELETTNEELQATNEELETMNEELQSTNEELQTINDELRDRTDDLDHANAFLEGVFASLGRAVVVVDRALRVTVWNSDAQDLWGLRREEVEGGSFLALEIGLPVGELRPLLRACLDGGEAGGIVLDAVTRRGKAIRCAVSCAPLTTGEERAGVIVTMDPEGSAPE